MREDLEKIKITRNPTKGKIPELLWYYNRVGEVFDVVADSESEEGVFVHKEEPYSTGFVYSSDFEEVDVCEWCKGSSTSKVEDNGICHDCGSHW